MSGFRLRRADGGATVRGAYTLRGLDQVGDQLDLQWAVRALAADTLDVRWAIRDLVADQADLRWQVRTAAGDTIDLRWTLRAIAGDIADLRWQVLSLLSIDPHLVIAGAVRARHQATLSNPRYQAGAVQARIRTIDLRRTP